jgi:hypothetical protein
MPVEPVYTTDPRYLVPAVRPVKDRLMVPVAPIAADAGALTAMLPASADPSSHENNVKSAVPETPNP